jgi:cytochrome c biogenesis protein CcdA
MPAAQAVEPKKSFDYRSFIARPLARPKAGMEGFSPKLMGFIIILGLLFMFLGAMMVNLSFASSDPFDGAVQHDPDDWSSLHRDHGDEYHDWQHEEHYKNLKLMKAGVIFYNLGFMFVAMALLVGGVANQSLSDLIRITLIVVAGIMLIHMGFDMSLHYDGSSLAPH